ncbi:MAG: HRDC domain-containing protein [Saprospiraceae bacterium]|nr:HRDC domain-containing protein [Saprospiraceae bacterium]
MAIRKSRSEGVPPYIIFNDNTLKEIATQKPLFVEELRAISGIGDVKFDKYAFEIMEVLQNAVVSDETNALKKGKTYLETKMLLDSGKTPEQIASLRNISKKYSLFTHRLPL